MKSLLGYFGLSVLLSIIGIVGLVVIVAAIAAGLGLISGLVMAILVGLLIFFGSIEEITGSIVIGYILKAFVTEIQSFAGIWWNGPSATTFFSLVATTGYLKIMVVTFFLAYALSFFTSRIQILAVRVPGSSSMEGLKKEKVATHQNERKKNA